LSLGTDFSFKLSNGAEHVEEQSAGGVAGIDVLVKHLQVNSLTLQLLSNLTQMQGGAGQSVKSRDHQRIAFPDIF
jgi:hypothetical protein